MSVPRRLIVGVSGAGGSLDELSEQARQTIEFETDYTARDFEAFADVVHHDGDFRSTNLESSTLFSRAETAPLSVRRGDPSPRFSLTPVY